MHCLKLLVIIAENMPGGISFEEKASWITEQVKHIE